MNRFLIICEHFPIKAVTMADSIGVSVLELRRKVMIGEYYINDNAELVSNDVTIAVNRMSSACAELIKKNS